MGGFAFSRSESKPLKWWTRKLRELGRAATRAFFGATVHYADAKGAERVVSIVGTDEVDLNRNHISWVSPLGRALIPRPRQRDSLADANPPDEKETKRHRC
jgi:hypothetical protein